MTEFISLIVILGVHHLWQCSLIYGVFKTSQIVFKETHPEVAYWTLVVALFVMITTPFFVFLPGEGIFGFNIRALSELSFISIEQYQNYIPLVGLAVFWIWIIGAAIVLVQFSKALIHANLLKTSGAAVSILGVNNSDTQQASLSTIISNDASSPMLVGMLKPAIILPAEFFKSSSLAELRAIIRHERRHLEHYDHFFAFFEQLLYIIFWWNPFVTSALSQISTMREVACDNHVAHKEGGPISYAKLLIKSARYAQLPKRGLKPAGLYAHEKLSYRIQMLLSLTRSRTPLLVATHSTWLSIFVVFSFAFIAIATPRICSLTGAHFSSIQDVIHTTG